MSIETLVFGFILVCFFLIVLSFTCLKNWGYPQTYRSFWRCPLQSVCPLLSWSTGYIVIWQMYSKSQWQFCCQPFLLFYYIGSIAHFSEHSYTKCTHWSTPHYWMIYHVGWITIIYTFLYFLCVSEFHHNTYTETGLSGENRLHNRLSRIQYSSTVRPVLSSNISTPINLAIAPSRLIRVVSIFVTFIHHYDMYHLFMKPFMWMRA